MASRWSDHDLPLRRSVRLVRSPWANLNVNSGRQLLDKWVVGVDESPAASCKTLSSAPYLLNRAKLIWVSWGTVCLALSLPRPGLSGSCSRTLWRDTWLLMRTKKSWPLSWSVVCQTTWQKPSVSAWRTASKRLSCFGMSASLCAPFNPGTVT